jgi:HD superfamily phosphohydrolase
VTYRRAHRQDGANHRAAGPEICHRAPPARGLEIGDAKPTTGGRRWPRCRVTRCRGMPSMSETLGTIRRVPRNLTPGRIRDPVHGYIAFTAIERALLDHPIAQRLRSVGQSAAAHLVFPEMRVSRLAHSLGAMHLASRFLETSLANAHDAERDRLLAAFGALVERHQGLGLGHDVEHTMAKQGLLAGRDRGQRDRIAALLVEQGLRLASLVHDLGHLPYSHDFEVALDDHFRRNRDARERATALLVQGAGGDAIHERVGYALANVVQSAVFNEELAGTPLSKPAEVALLIARDLLNAPAAPQLADDEHAAVISWLHSLVAGEIDVDRADYVLRDVRHYGLAAAVYDLDRLVDHLAPVLAEDGQMVTTILPQGVSAAEAFLVARFRMYAWAVYHHKIQQAAAGLRVATTDLLAAGGDDTLTFLADINEIASGQPGDAVLDRFIDYDDSWWTGLLRARLHDGADPLVEPWLALFTRRRPGPVSLWKRASDFPRPDRAAWNRRLPGSDDLELKAAWEDVRATLRREGVLLERLPFRPWRDNGSGESMLQVRTESELLPLTRLSPLVRALAQAWSEELQVLAFADRPGRIERADLLERLEPALRPEENQ